MTSTKTKAAVGTTINSRFAGYCRKCDRGFSAGEPITKVAEKVWVHKDCASHRIPEPQTQAEPRIEPTVPAPTKPVAEEMELVRAIVRDELTGATLSVDQDEVRGVVRDELTKAGVCVHKIQVTSPVGEVRTFDGKAHPEMQDILTLASRRKNVLLIGPAGSGKTHLARQVAEAMDLPFAFISCSAGMSEGQLLGRLIPTGESGKFEYIRSEFVKTFEEGGVFLFDELDAADSNTLLVLNAALANGHMAVPNRPSNPVAVKHPDFVCIGAANTFGTGADRQYVGRNQLDESTLDRFRIGQIEMDYDAELEAMLCPDDSLRTSLQEIRQKASAGRVRRVISTRFMRDAHEMKQAGWTEAKIMKRLFAGWSADEIAKVK